MRRQDKSRYCCVEVSVTCESVCVAEVESVSLIGRKEILGHQKNIC